MLYYVLLVFHCLLKIQPGRQKIYHACMHQTWWGSSLKLTWTRIMLVFPLTLSLLEMLVVMTSMLCFSNTEMIVGKMSWLWAEQMENWASSPWMFNTIFEAAQVLSKATCFFPVVIETAFEVAITSLRTYWALSCFCFSSFLQVSSKNLMYFTTSSIMVALSIYEINKKVIAS